MLRGRYEYIVNGGRASPKGGGRGWTTGTRSHGHTADLDTVADIPSAYYKPFLLATTQSAPSDPPNPLSSLRPWSVGVYASTYHHPGIRAIQRTLTDGDELLTIPRLGRTWERRREAGSTGYLAVAAHCVGAGFGGREASQHDGRRMQRALFRADQWRGLHAYGAQVPTFETPARSARMDLALHGLQRRRHGGRVSAAETLTRPLFISLRPSDARRGPAPLRASADHPASGDLIVREM